jgi:hypothetical protein
VDTWFWLARTHVKRNDPKAARPYLEKIAASEVKYEKKPGGRDAPEDRVTPAARRRRYQPLLREFERIRKPFTQRRGDLHQRRSSAAKQRLS